MHSAHLALEGCVFNREMPLAIQFTGFLPPGGLSLANQILEGNTGIGAVVNEQAPSKIGVLMPPELCGSPPIYRNSLVPEPFRKGIQFQSFATANAHSTKSEIANGSKGCRIRS